MANNENDEAAKQSLNHFDATEISPQQNEEKPTPSSTWAQSIKFHAILLFATVLLMVTRSVDFVLLVRMVKKMHNYEVFLSNILLSLIFTCVFWPITWFRMFVTKQVTPAMRQFPKWKFFCIGVLDCIGNLLIVLPSAYVPGPVNVLMAQCAILVNMIISYFVLGHRYNALHIGGAIVVYIGVAIDVLPLFLNSSELGSVGPWLWVWILILFLSAIPNALSNVVKEYFLKDYDMDIWYIQSYCMTFQFVFGIISFPVALIPFPAPYSFLTITEVPRNFLNGILCFVGINSVESDKCDYFYLVLLVFMVFNLTFNYCMLYVFKHASSSLGVAATAARLALSNALFLVPFIAGEATTHHITFFDIEALVMVIAGVVMYSLTKERQAKPEEYVTARIGQCLGWIRNKIRPTTTSYEKV